MPLEMLNDATAIYRCPLCNSIICNRIRAIEDRVGETHFSQMSEVELLSELMSDSTTQCGHERYHQARNSPRNPHN